MSLGPRTALANTELGFMFGHLCNLLSFYASKILETIDLSTYFPHSP